MRAQLTAVVIARDEADMIGSCLDRLRFADDVLVLVDDRTTDDTAAIARSRGARVVEHTFTTFGAAHETALANVGTPWVLFVGADERVTPALAAEIEAAVRAPAAAWRVPIENWFYGHRVARTGYREQPVRLLPVEGASFRGAIHESAVVPPGTPVRALTAPIVHFTHRSVIDNLSKTATYADIQAAEMLAAGHRRITRWTLLRVAATTLARHLLWGQGFRDGEAGFIESFYQAFSIFSVHARLWELQQSPSIPDRYKAVEASL